MGTRTVVSAARGRSLAIVLVIMLSWLALPVPTAQAQMATAPGGVAADTALHGVQATPARESSALSTSAAGLHVVATPPPGGGVMVNLQGRFRNVVTAHLDADGKLSTTCSQGATAGTAGKQREE